MNRRQFLVASSAIAVLPSAFMLDGCTGASIAQDIVNWTPALQSTAATVASTVALLVPPDAPIIAAALVGFDAATNLAVAEAKAYLANPGQTTLQALQTAVVTLQQQVNTTLLTAAKIINPQSQAVVTAALNAVATVINSIFALILQIKGNTVAAMANPKTVKLYMVYNPAKGPTRYRTLVGESPWVSEGIVATHYSISREEAGMRIKQGRELIVQAGF
jgi:hypothetical protein